jgi:hypothetical protein
MLAPGISDNGTGLAALAAIRAIHEAQIKPHDAPFLLRTSGKKAKATSAAYASSSIPTMTA